MSLRKHGVGEVIETEPERQETLTKQASASWTQDDEQRLSDESES